MRRILLSGLFLLLPATAHAQAQGGPDAPKPPADAAKPADTAKPPADASKPADATPPASTTPAPATPAAPTDASAGTGAAAEVNAGGPAGPSAAANAGATTELEKAPPPKPVPVVARRGQTAGSEESSWKFDYHGYLRAPLRFGIGKRLPEDTPGYDPSLQGETTWHEATVPDDQYLSFQSTGHNMRSWGEGFFTFGNQLASGTLGIGSYNFTETGFNDVDAQWGITQGYVTLTPDLGYENVRLWAKVGAIVDKYGQAGRYDPGEFDTYMFGRTHVMGETLHVDYDITDAWTLGLEQGFGSKKPDPSQYNNARYTMLHHEHVTLKQGRDLEFGAHFLHSWSNEEYRTSQTVDTATGIPIPRNGLPTGHLWVAGAEARAELGAFGYIYGAFSHVGANYAVTVSRAIEVLSSSGGGEFELGVTANYLDSPLCNQIIYPVVAPPVGAMPQPGWTSRDPNGCSDGKGGINAVQAHYEFSLTNFQDQISGGERFWGRGFDVILKLYGLAAFVNSEARDTTAVDEGAALTTAPADYSVTKWKAGADVTVQVADFLSPGLRFDHVNPNNHIPEQAFSVLSPRLQFKSAWVTHERITLGYSRYFYNTRTCEPGIVNGVQNPDQLFASRCTQPPPSAVPYDGFGSRFDKQDAGNRGTGVRRPDENVFKVEATMWW
jgi:hypothetical protein